MSHRPFRIDARKALLVAVLAIAFVTLTVVVVITTIRFITLD